MKINKIVFVGLACMMQALTAFGQKDYKLSVGIGTSSSVSSYKRNILLNPSPSQYEIFRYGLWLKDNYYIIGRLEREKDHLDITFGIEYKWHHFNSVNGYFYVASNNPQTLSFIHGNLHQPRKLAFKFSLQSFFIRHTAVWFVWSCRHKL